MMTFVEALSQGQCLHSDGGQNTCLNAKALRPFLWVRKYGMSYSFYVILIFNDWNMNNGGNFYSIVAYFPPVPECILFSDSPYKLTRYLENSSTLIQLTSEMANLAKHCYFLLPSASWYCSLCHQISGNYLKSWKAAMSFQIDQQTNWWMHESMIMSVGTNDSQEIPFTTGMILLSAHCNHNWYQLMWNFYKLSNLPA